MGIVASEIKFYKAVTNNDLGGNGGRKGSTQIITSILNNLFPNVTAGERTSGITRYRKCFIRNENSSELVLGSTYLWISARSPADDYFHIKQGTDDDVQTAAVGYSNWAATGLLDQDANALDMSIDVDYDVASGVYNGSYVYISDGVNSEVAIINGAPAWVGTVATLSLTVGLQYSYLKTTTYVGTMINLGDLDTSFDTWVETSGSGTFDEVSYPPSLYNIGTISESWTITFTSASAFSCAGANVGTIGAGNISGNFSPVNGGSYYFTIDAGGWGGTWQSGDKVTFNTVHAGAGIWVKEIVSAAIAAYANNTLGLSWKGESAP